MTAIVEVISILNQVPQNGTFANTEDPDEMPLL